MLKTMIESVNRKVVTVLMRGQMPVRETEEVKEAQKEVHQDYSKMKANKDEISGTGAAASQQTQEQKQQPVTAAPHVGRNEACPCGSGKKYKNCHGKTN